MKAKLGIISSDDLFLNKARIIMRNEANAVRIDSTACRPEEYDVIFADVRDVPKPDFPCVTFGTGADLPFPFRHDEMMEEFLKHKGHTSDRPMLYLDGKTAYLNTSPIKLTNAEANLLKQLLSARGESISIHTLCERLLCDTNTLRVTVNRLRKKLEAGGDKIIFTSQIRGICFYTVHNKYFGGPSNADLI